jgi:hypothetical protein
MQAGGCRQLREPCSSADRSGTTDLLAARCRVLAGRDGEDPQIRTRAAGLVGAREPREV